MFVHTKPIPYLLVLLHIPLPAGTKNGWDLWYQDQSGIKKTRYTNTNTGKDPELFWVASKHGKKLSKEQNQGLWAKFNMSLV
jgi:hypothetical protein